MNEKWEPDFDDILRGLRRESFPLDMVEAKRRLEQAEAKREEVFRALKALDPDKLDPGVVMLLALVGTLEQAQSYRSYIEWLTLHERLVQHSDELRTMRDKFMALDIKYPGIFDDDSPGSEIM